MDGTPEMFTHRRQVLCFSIEQRGKRRGMADQDLERILADLLTKREALARLTFTTPAEEPATADGTGSDVPVGGLDSVEAERGA